MTDTLMTVLGIFFIFFMTSLGSAFVFFFKKDISSKLNTIFLGFAAGIMSAAAVWSLIIPAIDNAVESGIYGIFSWVPAAVGIVIGGLFMVLMDKVVPHFHKGTNEEEGPHTSLKKATKMFLAVTIHNIPEGLAVGFAFGAASSIQEPIARTAAMVAALGLAIGMGIQNLPEGTAVTLPLSSVTGSKTKAFGYGVLSGSVEPIFAVVGYFLAAYIGVLQPWLLSMSAGAMIFVVVEDLIPDAKLSENSHLGTWSILLGFAIMMVLDVALG